MARRNFLRFIKPEESNTMLKLTQKLAAAALLLAGAALVHAQDSKVLLDALIKKGVLTSEEARQIEADMKKSAPVYAVPGAKPVSKLTLGARLQIQYAGLSTDIDGTNADPASTNHFFLRRVYLVTKANFGSNWSMNITYDAAESLFDAAMVQYKNGDFGLDLGLRKAPLGFEELTSSGSLKAIERSGVTRYFIEPNNGRRLGASGYRVGVFAEGKAGDFFYGAAVTNPERVASATDMGNATNNKQALWAHGGYKGKFTDGSFTIGGAVGHLPDQGGRTGTSPFGVGTGSDLTIWSAYGDVTLGAFQLSGEYLSADVERGNAAGTANVTPSGFWLMGAYKFNKAWEGVVRYSSLDTDGRGVNLSDSVRSAPSGGTMDKLQEFFLGANWYIQGNDLKWQFGYVYGKSENTVTGGPAKAETNGIRSQFQINF